MEIKSGGKKEVIYPKEWKVGPHMKRLGRRNIVGAKPYMAPPSSYFVVQVASYYYTSYYAQVQVAAGKGAAEEWVENLPSFYEDVSVINSGRGGHYEFHRRLSFLWKLRLGTRVRWISDSTQQLLATSQSLGRSSQRNKFLVRFPDQQKVTRRERERMWIGGTLLWLPIQPLVVKSTNINIHSLLSIPASELLMSTSRAQTLASSAHETVREVCPAPEKIESIRRPPPTLR